MGVLTLAVLLPAGDCLVFANLADETHCRGCRGHRLSSQRLECVHHQRRYSGGWSVPVDAGHHDRRRLLLRRLPHRRAVGAHGGPLRRRVGAAPAGPAHSSASSASGPTPVRFSTQYVLQFKKNRRIKGCTFVRCARLQGGFVRADGWIAALLGGHRDDEASRDGDH